MADTFHGLLPALVHPAASASAPAQPMNDRNEEETGRYVPLTSCQYFVLSMPTTTTVTPSPLQAHVIQRMVAGTNAIAGGGGESVTRLHCERLIDPSRSPSMLARAFEIPFFSQLHNQFVDYCLFKNKDDNVK